MGKKKSIEASIQSKIDNTRDAKNSDNGFKNTMSAGTRGVGDTFGGKK